MRRAAIILTLIAGPVPWPAAWPAYGEEGGGMAQTLALPRPLASGAGAFLEVRVGPLAPGRQVRVTTSSGALLGTIAPFGPAARGVGGVYSLPVPADAIRNEALSVSVTVEGGNEPPRAPSAAEVQGLKLVAPDPAR